MSGSYSVRKTSHSRQKARDRGLAEGQGNGEKDTAARPMGNRESGRKLLSWPEGRFKGSARKSVTTVSQMETLRHRMGLIGDSELCPLCQYLVHWACHPIPTGSVCFLSFVPQPPIQHWLAKASWGPLRMGPSRAPGKKHQKRSSRRAPALEQGHLGPGSSSLLICREVPSWS